MRMELLVTFCVILEMASVTVKTILVDANVMNAKMAFINILIAIVSSISNSYINQSTVFLMF